MISSIPIQVELQADAAKREVTLYATQIGNRDLQGMRAMPGCFQQTINTRLPAGLIKFCRNHEDRNSGVVRHAEEDSYGLLTVSYVSKTQCGDEILAQIADGSLTHASYRGSVVRGQWVQDGEDELGHPIETLNLLEVKLKEVGPVDFDPANPGATIVAVKSMGADLLDDLRELPHLLKSMTLARERALTGDERKAATGLLALRKSLEEHGGLLEALLAPGSATPFTRTAPDRPTQEAVEKADRELGELMQLIKARGLR